MINWTPDPIALSIGPLTIYWYGIMYALGLAATFVVVEREARRRGLDTGVLVNGIILVAVAALIGGRLYHVIDQWARYKDDLLAIVLPPYSGLGVYGGIFTGFLAGMLYARWKGQPVLTWVDVAMPGIFTMQAIGRWGNFFNQELYGPPTDLPWGIAIECANRTATWACPPLGTTAVDAHFQPLFLYESLSGALGAIVLLLVARRVALAAAGRPRPPLLRLVRHHPLPARDAALEQLDDRRDRGRLDHQRDVRRRGAGGPRLAPPAGGPAAGGAADAADADPDADAPTPTRCPPRRRPSRRRRPPPRSGAAPEAPAGRVESPPR